MKYLCEDGYEAYGSIQRQDCPNWAGWKIIDHYKKSHLAKDRIDELLEGNHEFQALLSQVT